jgi:hypothetical protein
MDELVRIWKEAVMAGSRYYSRISRGTEVSHEKNSMTIAGVPT